MRHCRKNCDILPYVGNKVCPILQFSKTRKESEWYFVKDGKKLIPLCEENYSKVSEKKGLMVL